MGANTAALPSGTSQTLPNRAYNGSSGGSPKKKSSNDFLDTSNEKENNNSNKCKLIFSKFINKSKHLLLKVKHILR